MTATCIHCQKEFERNKGGRGKGRPRCYCSNDCRLTACRESRSWKPMAHIWYKYGMTHEQRQAMLDKQHNKCAICKTISDDLVIDHNHQTGKIRAMLCRNCNMGIGSFKEDIARLDAAKAYLLEQNYE